MFEHAFDHHAGQQRLAALRMADHLLDVIGRPAGAGDRIAAVTERMHAHGQIGALGGRVDRPIAALAERLRRAAEEEHLGEIGIAGATLDLGRGAGAVLVVHEHRGLELA